MKAIAASCLLCAVLAGCGTESSNLLPDCTDAWWFAFGNDVLPGQVLDNNCSRISFNDIDIHAGQTYTQDITGWHVAASPDLAAQGDVAHLAFSVDGIAPAKSVRAPWIAGDGFIPDVTVFQWDPPLRNPKTLTIEPADGLVGGLLLVFVNEACEEAHPLPECGKP